jgi:predicted nucleotidyltransferase
MLTAITHKLVQRFNPERVILFGSHASGWATAESDIDLLVVMPFSGSRSPMQAQLRLSLREFPVAVDIVVTTPEEFSWRSQVCGTIERPAVLEGRVLHAA